MIFPSENRHRPADISALFEAFFFFAHLKTVADARGGMSAAAPSVSGMFVSW
jgi:hypothetical protein